MRLTKKQLILLISTIVIMVFVLIYTIFTRGDSSNLTATGAENVKGKITIWPFALFFILVLYRVASPYITKIIAKKQFESDKLVQKETEYTFSSDGIKAESDVKIVNLRWPELSKIVETKQYFVLYERAQAANIIPKRCFASEEELLAFTKIIQDNLTETKYEKFHSL
ncbi:MAG: YcxB family protein [Mobilitalea sp.]